MEPNIGSTLSSLISLLPTAKYDLWVREMTVSGLDFRNPVGVETFNCFKKACVIERNTNECSRSESNSKDVHTTAVKKTVKSSYEEQYQQEEGSGSETEPAVHAISGSNPKPWDPPAGLKFPCPMAEHRHEVSKCTEFFD